MLYINARFLTQPITGVQRFAIELSVILRNLLAKTDLVFVAPKNILHKDIANVLDVEIVGTQTGHLWEQIDLPNYLKKKGKPLLLNLGNTAPLYYANKIVTIHDIAFKLYPQTYNKKFVAFYNFLIPKIIRRSKHVITVSQFSKDEIIKYYQTAYSKISVIYNAASGQFNKTDKIVRDIQGKQYFSAVSSLNYRKNLPLILKAFSLLSEDRDDIYLLVIGGMDKKSFSSMDWSKYNDNKHIIFTGRVTDEELVSYYSHTIGFVYPSIYEGFGIPPLEAQQCGAPVILSDASCFPEIFGESVLYCDANDPSSLLKKMTQLITDNSLSAQLVENGYRNCQKYSWQKSGEKLFKILQNFL